jgi:hypothetical protein
MRRGRRGRGPNVIDNTALTFGLRYLKRQREAKKRFDRKANQAVRATGVEGLSECSLSGIVTLPGEVVAANRTGEWLRQRRERRAG